MIQAEEGRQVTVKTIQEMIKGALIFITIALVILGIMVIITIAAVPTHCCFTTLQEENVASQAGSQPSEIYYKAESCDGTTDNCSCFGPDGSLRPCPTDASACNNNGAEACYFPPNLFPPPWGSETTGYYVSNGRTTPCSLIPE